MTTLSVCFNVLLLQVVWGFAQLKLSGTVTEIDNTQDQNKTERNVTSTDVVGSCTTEASESVLHLYLMYIAQCSSHFGVFFWLWKLEILHWFHRLWARELHCISCANCISSLDDFSFFLISNFIRLYMMTDSICLDVLLLRDSWFNFITVCLWRIRNGWVLARGSNYCTTIKVQLPDQC